MSSSSSLNGTWYFSVGIHFEYSRWTGLRFGRMGTNNVLVGASIHSMSASAVQTADTAALAERANSEGNVNVQHVRLNGHESLAMGLH